MQVPCKVVRVVWGVVVDQGVPRARRDGVMRPRRRCLERTIHSADAHLLHNLVKHESIMVLHPGLGKLLLDVLEFLSLKLWYIPWLKILVVGADVPVDSRLKVAHEFETLGELVLQKVGLRILNEAEEVRERGHLRDPGGELIWQLHMCWCVLKPSGSVVDRLFDEVGNLINDRLSEICERMKGV